MSDLVAKYARELEEAPIALLRRFAARTLGQSADGKAVDDRAVEALVRALADKDHEVAAEAARALGRLKDLRALEPLEALIGRSVSVEVDRAVSEALEALYGAAPSGERATPSSGAAPASATGPEGTQRIAPDAPLPRPVALAPPVVRVRAPAPAPAPVDATTLAPRAAAAKPNARPEALAAAPELPALLAGARDARGRPVPDREARRAQLIAEALATLPCQILARSADHIEVDVSLGKRRQRVVVGFDAGDEVGGAGGDALIVVQSTGGKATEDNYRWALRLNLRLAFGKIAIRRIDQEEMFVFVQTLLEPYTHAAELRKAIEEAATRADWIERQLHGGKDRF